MIMRWVRFRPYKAIDSVIGGFFITNLGIGREWLERRNEEITNPLPRHVSVLISVPQLIGVLRTQIGVLRNSIGISRCSICLG